ncbi:hypothetical protein WJX72_002171 [[Myrmecia] bisecta]|uniref:Probable glutamyl endopeptidase, chloroplastic n=1 Tax=[Myrmecia] bisecta TaxID=41462 RepID=A0AAW1R507_9CHLO
MAAHASAAPQAQREVATGYRLPPKEIAEIVDHPPEPNLSFSPDRKKVLQLDRPPPNPPITELARAELKLAGLRIDAEQWSRSRMGYNTGLALFDMTDDLVLPPPEGTQTRIHGIPEGYWINYVTWSDDSRWLAFTLRSTGAADAPPRGPLELWVADVETGTARPLLPDFGVNSIFDDYVWVDNDTIIATVVPRDVGPPPARPPVPVGPKIQDNTEGKLAQARTYPDLLKDEHDEELFEYYTTSQLAFITVSTGEVKLVGPARMYTDITPSPDAQWLLIAWIERPFSFNVPCGRFPKRVELWDRQGKPVKELAYLPLAEDIPIAFNSVRQGPRSLGFRSDQPAELTWIECQDGGDPAVEVSPRDIVYTLPAAEAAAGAPPRRFTQTDLRCGGVAWGRGDLALVYESWWKTRRSIVYTIAPDNPEAGMKVLFDRNSEDAYTSPGSPASRRTANGSYVLAMVDDERKLLMQGTGASPEGNRPFLDVLEVDTGKTERLWQSSPPHLEYTSSLFCDLDDAPIRLADMKLLLSRESATEPPQIYIQSWSGQDSPPTERKLTDFPHPYPTLKNIQKEIVRYKRADGLDLSATLYLPPGYDKERGGKLPCLLWAYPKEYKSKDAAGQIRTSPHQFSGIGSTSPLLWLSRKYAILDGPAMPIVAEGDAEPNDTYVEQLTASARAAVEELDRRGVVDLARIAVGGHSYGAFMAANLLAHAPDLFACGIARSGAYNRTLTPFGFQAEERTIWQAADTYSAMSPFLQAHRIHKPLLLIHGEDDNNTGTFPMQSERFYSALKGHGAPCKLVLLPHESHGYRARESIMHTLYEMDAWMERYCVATSDASANGNSGEARVSSNGGSPVPQPLSKL